MNLDHSHSLVPSSGDQLPVAVRPERSVASASSNILVPGRILNHVYSSVGDSLGNSINRVAHRLGLEPVAAPNRTVTGRM